MDFTVRTTYLSVFLTILIQAEVYFAAFVICQPRIAAVFLDTVVLYAVSAVIHRFQRASHDCAGVILTTGTVCNRRLWAAIFAAAVRTAVWGFVLGFFGASIGDAGVLLAIVRTLCPGLRTCEVSAGMYVAVSGSFFGESGTILCKAGMGRTILGDANCFFRTTFCGAYRSAGGEE